MSIHTHSVSRPFPIAELLQACEYNRLPRLREILEAAASLLSSGGLRAWAVTTDICLEDQVQATASGTQVRSGQSSLLNVWFEGWDGEVHLSLPLPAGSRQASNLLRRHLANQQFAPSPAGEAVAEVGDGIGSALRAAGWRGARDPQKLDPNLWRQSLMDELRRDHAEIELESLGVIREDRLLLGRQPNSAWSVSRERVTVTSTSRARKRGPVSWDLAVPGDDLSELTARASEHARLPSTRSSRFNVYSLVTLGPYALAQLLASLGSRVEILGTIVGGPHVSFSTRSALPLPLVDEIRLPAGHAVHAGQAVLRLDEIRESETQVTLIFTTEQGDGGVFRMSWENLALALDRSDRRGARIVGTRLGDLCCHVPAVVIGAE